MCKASPQGCEWDVPGAAAGCSLTLAPSTSPSLNPTSSPSSSPSLNPTSSPEVRGFVFRSVSTHAGNTLDAYSCQADADSGFSALGNAANVLALCGPSPLYAKVLTSPSVSHLNVVMDEGGSETLGLDTALYTPGDVSLGTWGSFLSSGVPGVSSSMDSLEEYGVLPVSSFIWTGANPGGEDSLLTCGNWDALVNTRFFNIAGGSIASSSSNGAGAMGGFQETDCTVANYVLCVCW